MALIHMDFTSGSGRGGGAVDSVNGQTGEVVLNIEDINDVSLTSLSENDTLVRNGSNEWVNVPLPNELKDLTGDVAISGTPTDGHVLTYEDSSSKWKPKALPAGGHTMIPVSNDMNTIKGLTDGDDNYVINAYSAQRWANCEAIALFTTISRGTNTVGIWEDDWKGTGKSRDGWLFSVDLYRVLEDEYGNPVLDIEINPIQDTSKNETVSLYSYRIDDEYYIAASPAGTENPSAEGWFEYDDNNSVYVLSSDTTVDSEKTYYIGGGCVAFKLNSPVKSSSGLSIGLSLKHQRTNVKNFTVISEEEGE